MPLASTLPLSAHFTSFELGADKPEANDRIIANLRFTAAGLERQRSVLNSRLLVNSEKHRNRGFRTQAENTAVGGSPTSDHTEGLSADYTALDFPDGMPEAYRVLRDSDLGSFDQIIFYPANNYIHAGFGGNRREFRVKLFEGAGGTPIIGSDFVQTLGGSVVYAAKSNPTGSIVLVAATVLFLVAVTRK
jgi:zinc D-Ala-D-Ala carboxypeptidase